MVGECQASVPSGFDGTTFILQIEWQVDLHWIFFFPLLPGTCSFQSWLVYSPGVTFLLEVDPNSPAFLPMQLQSFYPNTGVNVFTPTRSCPESPVASVLCLVLLLKWELSTMGMRRGRNSHSVPHIYGEPTVLPFLCWTCFHMSWCFKKTVLWVLSSLFFR